MPRGDKSSYTDKQKRQAEHIEEGYEERGVSKEEAESRAWATVNKASGGGKKSGSGRGKPENKAPAKKAARKAAQLPQHDPPPSVRLRPRKPRPRARRTRASRVEKFVRQREYSVSLRISVEYSRSRVLPLIPKSSFRLTAARLTT
jgi:plasmid stabilization system protein ParE